MIFEETNKKILTKRLLSFKNIFNNVNEYPHNCMMFGFGTIHFFNNSEVLGRIKEISELLNYKLEITTGEKMILEIFNKEGEVL